MLHINRFPHLWKFLAWEFPLAKGHSGKVMFLYLHYAHGPNQHFSDHIRNTFLFVLQDLYAVLMDVGHAQHKKYFSVSKPWNLIKNKWTSICFPRSQMNNLNQFAGNTCNNVLPFWLTLVRFHKKLTIKGFVGSLNLIGTDQETCTKTFLGSFRTLEYYPVAISENVKDASLWGSKRPQKCLCTSVPQIHNANKI